MKHELWIPQWKPVLLNQLLYKHRHVVRGLKQKDQELIARYFRHYDVPPATGKRRVSLRIILKPRGQSGDYDGPWKVLLDGLVKCGALIDDSPEHVQLGNIEYERGTAENWGTWIILEDIESEA